MYFLEKTINFDINALNYFKYLDIGYIYIYIFIYLQ